MNTIPNSKIKVISIDVDTDERIREDLKNEAEIEEIISHGAFVHGYELVEPYNHRIDIPNGTERSVTFYYSKLPIIEIDLTVRHRCDEETDDSKAYGSTMLVQNGVELGSNLLVNNNTKYESPVLLEYDMLLHSSSKEFYDFIGWQDASGNLLPIVETTYKTVNSMEMRVDRIVPTEDMTDIYAAYKKDDILHLIIKHKGSGVGSSNISVEGDIKGQGYGGEGTEYIAYFAATGNFDKWQEADEGSKYIRWEKEDGTEFAGGSIPTGSTLYVVFESIEELEYKTITIHHTVESSGAPPENEAIGSTTVRQNGVVLGGKVGARQFDKYEVVIALNTEFVLSATPVGSTYEFKRWKHNDGSTVSGDIEKTNDSTLLKTIAIKGTDNHYFAIFGNKEGVDVPDTPPTSNNDIPYLCDNSISPNSIDTDYWTGNKSWAQITKATVSHHLSKNLSGDFFNDRNIILEWFDKGVELPTNKSKTPSSLPDFYKLLWIVYKNINDGSLAPMNLTWLQFESWCDEELDCLTKLQKGMVFFTIKTKIPSLFHSSAENILSGKTPDVVCEYISKLPTKVVDWFDFNDIMPNGIDSITGAFSANVGIDDEYPEFFRQFSTFINFEPQMMEFGTDSAHASQPMDYLNDESTYHTAQVWGAYESYITTRFKNADTEEKTAIVGAEVAIHEYGHSISSYGHIQDNVIYHDTHEWRKIGGWHLLDEGKHIIKTKQMSETNMMPKSDAGFEAPPTAYGCTQPAEDYAETFRCYIFNPDFLKDYFPQRYDYMRNIVNPLL